MAALCTVGAVACVSALLGGCSGAFMGDHVPTAVGGLPENTPARTNTDSPYPAVHSMPPSRSAPLSDDQQRQLADDLIAARARANTIPPDPPAPAGSTPDSKAGSARNQ